MPRFSKAGRMLTFLLIVGLLSVLGCQSLVRRVLFYPTHDVFETSLAPWKHGEELIGYGREVPEPRHVWLMLHGNGGQAAHRTYALHAFDGRDSVYVLEYPGYGHRKGTPSRRAFDAAAKEAYAALRARFPDRRICVAGESLGSGPASVLASATPPPDKIVLVVPFDSIRSVGRHHTTWLPTSLILAGTWDNIAALRDYRGPVEIFAAERDEVIPASHARALAKSLPQARFHLIPGGHGWANGRDVTFRCDPDDPIA
jgi:pimeloyl-ACP methyl ester carboxylesterase